MKLKLILAGVAVLAVSAGLLIITNGDSAKDISTGEAPVGSVGPNQPPPTATRSVGNRQAVVWTEIAPPTITDISHGMEFLLDTETGKIYSPTDRNEQGGPFTQMRWEVDGQLSVWIYPRHSNEGVGDTLFIGPPLGPMTGVSATETYVSSRGVAASYEPGSPGAMVIREVATRRELARVPLKTGQYGGPWSPDRKFLSLRSGGDPEKKVNPSVSLWDIDSAQVVLELPTHEVWWANQHNRFQYAVVDLARGEDSFVEARVRDMETGSEYVLNSRSGVVLWSPTDDYLVTDAPDNDRSYAFSVFDASDGTLLTTARGSWPMAWTDEDSVGFMTNVCTDSMLLYYVDAGGSNLHRVLDLSGYGVTHPSPRGGRVAYTDYGDVLQQSNSVRIVDVVSGRTQEFDVGAAYLPPHPWVVERVWSPDGRFLLLMSPVGKDGPCMATEPEPFQLIRHP